MATTLDEIVDTAEHPRFVRRVMATAVKAAISVGNEAPDAANPERSTARRALAINVLNAPEAYAARFAYAMATNATITVDSIDGDLDWTISTVWDAIAGAPQAAA